MNAKQQQASNAVMNTLLVHGIDSFEFYIAIKEYIKQASRYTSGGIVEIHNNELKIRQGYRFCGEPWKVQDCRVNSLYTRN